MAPIKPRLPLCLFLGSVFLAMVHSSVGLAYWEKQNPEHHVCVKRCISEDDGSKYLACHARCKLMNEIEEEQQDDPQEQGQHRKNPYHFGSNRFHTRFENEHGSIRVLERFDQRSEQLARLQNVRFVELELKPHALILPHHLDAGCLLVALSGRAIVSLLDHKNRLSFNFERGDVMRIPIGTIAYAANPDDNHDFRVISLAYPFNVPDQFEYFFPSGNQSYYNAFSKETLEATFNVEYDEIQKVVFGEEGHDQIVKLSNERIRELRRLAKQSPKGGSSSRLGPSTTRDLQPHYSNNYGKFWEASFQDFPPLQDVGISITFTDLNQGSLFLPHYNSRALVVAQVVDGKGRLEIAFPRVDDQRSGRKSEESEQKEQQQQDEDKEEQSEGQIEGASSELSQGDIFVVPASHPIALKASKRSNLRVIGFALYANNNQRNFLAGEKDNVINQIEREVKDLAFQGTGEEVEKLFRNQKESYFVNVQSQQKEGRKETKGGLSSTLGSFFDLEVRNK